MSYIDLRHSGSHLGDRVSVTAIKLGKGSANASKLQKIFNTPASRIPIPKTPMSFVTPTRIVEVRQFCQLQPEGQSLMRAAMSQLNLSARAYHRILKLSRTIVDLVGSEEIQSTHLAEALQYRPKLMMG